MDRSLELLGRAAELERLRALFSAARNQTGGALLVEGEPGMGKTSLLDAALHDQQGVRVLRVQGVDVESTMAYGVLQRLGRPLIAYVDDIPPAQRAALRVAAGVDDGPPPQPALVGLGFLSLLARAGDASPTVCVVDDAQHADAESLVVLGFVARRLSAESAAVVLASRPDERADAALAGVARMEVVGLDAESASTLLRGTVRGELDATVVADYVAYTDGNPLALRELAAEWTAQELTSTAFAHSPIPIGRRLEQIYAARLHELPDATRRWLLVAAAESTGELAAVHAAGAALGIPPDASAAAERIDFVRVRDTVGFRHPLIRSAVYATAPAADRRRVHAALRDGAAARGREEIAAWHAAAALDGPDDAVAAAVATAADAAGARGGVLSRAHLLARAAELSASPGARSERYVAAAEAALSAGAARLALQLLARTDLAALDDVGRARTLIVEAMCGLFLSDPDGLRGGMARLIAAGDLADPLAPDLVRRALLLALSSATVTEDRAVGADLDQLGIRMRAASAGTDLTAVVLRAAAAFVLDDYRVAAPLLREAVVALRAADDDALVGFAFFITVPCVALWDWDAAAELLQRVVRAGRAAGALREVDSSLWVLSAIELSRVNPAGSAEYLEQAAQLRHALGVADELPASPSQLAWQGADLAVVRQITQAMREAGWGGIARMAAGAAATAEIAAGEYGPAFEHLTPLVAHPFLQAGFTHLPEFIEAAVRSGNHAAARRPARALQMYAEASGSPVARGHSERAQALLASDADAESHYRASIELLDTPSHRGDAARTRLLFGEWLRRVRRRSEAREQLQRAHDAFVAGGASAFADRARRELLATGATVLDADAPRDPLTSQEREVARLAARGATNAEIAASLFISANTVDYHLRKVFRKLEIASRRQLVDRFAE